jgi:hypothetical protein
MPPDDPVAAYRDIEAARLDHTEGSTTAYPPASTRARSRRAVYAGLRRVFQVRVSVPDVGMI